MFVTGKTYLGIRATWLPNNYKLNFCVIPHCKDTIPKFETNIPRKKLAGLGHNFHSHVSVNDLYIPTIVLPILLQENMWSDPENI